jgi:hypothetical protein
VNVVGVCPGGVLRETFLFLAKFSCLVFFPKMAKYMNIVVFFYSPNFNFVVEKLPDFFIGF